MLKAIYLCNYGKSYFNSVISKTLRRDEYFIFDGRDSPIRIHDKIVGRFNEIRDGKIKIIFIISPDKKPARFEEADEAQRMEFLRLYYFNYLDAARDWKIIKETEEMIKHISSQNPFKMEFDNGITL